MSPFLLSLLGGCGTPATPSPVPPSRAPVGDVSLADASFRFNGYGYHESMGQWGASGGDLDGDGLVDVAVPQQGGCQVWLSSTGSSVLVDAHKIVRSASVAHLPDVGSVLALGLLRSQEPGEQVVAEVWLVDEHGTVQQGRFLDDLTSEFTSVSVLGVGEGLALSHTTGSHPAVWVFNGAGGDRYLNQDYDAKIIGPTADDPPELGSAADFDGDGVEDLLVELPGIGAVVVSGPFAASMVADPDVYPSIVATGPFSSGGDVDGDGAIDVVSAEGFLWSGPWKGRQYKAGALATFAAEEEAPFVSAAIAADVDGDGFDELLAGASGAGEGGMAALWYGPAKGALTLASADARLHAEGPADRAGNAVLGPGDTNGDGYGEIVVVAHEWAESTGAAYLLHGGLRP